MNTHVLQKKISDSFTFFDGSVRLTKDNTRDYPWFDTRYIKHMFSPSILAWQSQDTVNVFLRPSFDINFHLGNEAVN